MDPGAWPCSDSRVKSTNWYRRLDARCPSLCISSRCNLRRSMELTITAKKKSSSRLKFYLMTFKCSSSIQFFEIPFPFARELFLMGVSW